MAILVKTVKIGIHKEVHAAKRQAILATQELYNQTIAFYMEFFVGHLAVLDTKKAVHRWKSKIAEQSAQIVGSYRPQETSVTTRPTQRAHHILCG